MPLTVGQAALRVPRERRHPLEDGVAAAAGGHGAEVAVGRRRHVDLRGHEPLAARVRDERLPHGLDRVGGVDRRVDVPGCEDGDAHGPSAHEHVEGV